VPDHNYQNFKIDFLKNMSVDECSLCCADASQLWHKKITFHFSSGYIILKSGGRKLAKSNNMSNCTYPPCYMATTINGVDNNHPSHFQSDTIAIIAFLVVAVICILCVYVGSSFVDSRRCCCPNWFVSPAPVADHNVDLDQGPIARKAGLFGLNRQERRLILEHILTGAPYGSEWKTSSDEKRLAMKIDDTSAKATAESSLLTSEDLASGTGSAIEYTMDAKFVDIILEVGQRHNTTVCSICLNEYGMSSHSLPAEHDEEDIRQNT
jgi:hypothetical protein